MFDARCDAIDTRVRARAFGLTFTGVAPRTRTRCRERPRRGVRRRRTKERTVRAHAIDRSSIASFKLMMNDEAWLELQWWFRSRVCLTVPPPARAKKQSIERRLMLMILSTSSTRTHRPFVPSHAMVSLNGSYVLDPSSSSKFKDRSLRSW